MKIRIGIVGKSHLIILLLISYSTTLFAQSDNSVNGIVLNTQNLPLEGVIVTLNQVETKTDSNGSFVFEPVQPGKLAFTARAIGYETYTDTITKQTGKNLQLTITLLPASTVLNEIVVQGKTDNQLAKEQTIRAIVVDTREVAEQPVTLAELMNRSPGVRIRQSGGLGNQVDVSINGFQGRAIKYFKDGIPLDYLGEGYSINSLPIEMLERVEVYKGVLPIFLGADALGGALNLIPRKQNAPHSLNVSYETGSFNTHRTSLIGHKTEKNNNWVIGTELFFNSSDNDYKVWVDVPNPETRNPEPKRLPLFHNTFRSVYGEAYLSLIDLPWTDELRISIAAFDQSRDQQHPALFTDAYGAVSSGQNSIIPSLRYKKSFLSNRLHFDQFAVYNILKSQRIDTLGGRYDWYGNFTPSTGIGETRLPSLSDIHEKQTILRTNVKYDLSNNVKLAFNYVHSNATREGEDMYGPRFDGTVIDVLSVPATYSKNILGLSLVNSFLDNRLQQDFMIKHYIYSSKGTQNTWFSTAITPSDERQMSDSYWGIADALKYQINPNSLLRGSVEYAYRLPERDEIFGNNIFIVPNFELKPEKSLNANLGYQVSTEKATIDGNVFYRDTKDLLLLVPIQAPNAQYQNQENVTGYGFDVDVSYRFLEHYRLNANATWQNLRLKDITNAQDQWKNEARLRNTPYFFSNLGLQAAYKNVLSKDDQLRIYANYNFLREFYLETIPKNLEPNGFLGLFGSAQLNTDLIIPNQHLVDMGMTYKISNSGFTIGAEVRNILDGDMFDYYRIPRPGRNYSFKISYQLK